MKESRISRAIFESDSLLTVNVVNGRNDNQLEVGYVIENCHIGLRALPDISVNFV